MRRTIAAVVWAGALGLAGALAQDPFHVEASLTRGAGAPTLTVAFRVPPGHSLYEHMIEVAAIRPAGATLEPQERPSPRRKYDDLLGREVGYYDRDVVFTYRVHDAGEGPLTVRVAYQGCREDLCFMPQELEITVGSPSAAPGEPAAREAPSAPQEGWRGLADRFEVIGTGAGYMPPADFLRFLRDAEQGTAPETNVVERVFRRYGLLAALLAVVPLGLLLNLTPCVLPMIPVNLAIIGAGRGAGSRMAGFVRGAAYGAGMALVYGALGVAVVLTGSQFGALNASPWFNAGIAAVFVVLGLAMFDVLVLDLSRFQRGGTPADGARRSSPWVAFLLGGTAALLAGACVAPVLIWVLVLATSLYAQGRAAGLLLPLMLGVGMALPWPLAGAGLSVLPRPGRWMDWVRRAFGVIILLFAAYYGVLAVRLALARRGAAEAGLAGWTTDFTAGLRQALEERRPVFVDFWALSCKSCAKMKKTTFRDPAVQAALAPYVRVAFQTDDAGNPMVRAVADRYGVLGLPTYVVLRPRAP